MGLAIGGASLSANAALQASAVLIFDSGVTTCFLGGTYPTCTGGMTAVDTGSWFSMGGTTHTTARAAIINTGDGTAGPGTHAGNGIHIGTTSIATGSHSGPISGSESPAFDIWEYFGNTGMHYMDVAGTVTDNAVGGDNKVKELDWSGWTVNWNGVSDIPMDSSAWNGNPNGRAIITCNSASCSDSSTFSLDYSATVPSCGCGFTGVEYALHLEGVISEVPVPAAAWLFGTGLVGLVGVARRKRA